MKNRWKSKTWWASLITAATGLVAVFVPEVGTFMGENNEAVVIALGLVFAILRQTTTEPLK